jgi:tRNA nucleotidyltransferase/poly(A) polymerase
MEKTLRQQILDNLREFSTPERPVYLVGGAVRDILLDRPVHDLDFALPGETLSLARELARRLEGALYVLDEERGTTRVILDPARGVDGRPEPRMLLDFAALRAPTLEGDLRMRDFTINAMAFDVAHPGQLIDPTEGLADLREGRVRACAGDSLASDPVRVLRAVRQALQFQFRIDPETIRQMRAAAPLLPRISTERVRDELFRVLDGPRVSLAIRILDLVSGLPHVLPELEALKNVAQSPPHVSGVWEHTLRVVQHLEQLFAPLVGAYRAETVTDLSVGSAVLWLGRFRQQLEQHFGQAVVPDRSLKALLFLGALYHDVAKPATRTETPEGRARFLDHPEQGARLAGRRGNKLALSSPEISRLAAIVREHMRVHFLAGSYDAGPRTKPSRRAIYRFFRSAGPAGVDICLLSLADLRATYESALPQDLWQVELETCRALFEAYWERSAEVVSPPRLLTGAALIEALQLEPGPLVGRLLEALREAQAAGEVATKEEALAFLRLWLEKPAGMSLVSQESEE